MNRADSNSLSSNLRNYSAFNSSFYIVSMRDSVIKVIDKLLSFGFKLPFC